VYTCLSRWMYVTGESNAKSHVLYLSHKNINFIKLILSYVLCSSMLWQHVGDIGGYHCIGWSQRLFLQDLHSWWIPTFQKNVLLLSLRHQHRWWWHCVLPERWYPPTSTQFNVITLPTAIWVFTTVKTINFTHWYYQWQTSTCHF